MFFKHLKKDINLLELNNYYMDFKKRQELSYQIFSPSAPIENPDLFIGRIKQLEMIRDMVEERGQHAIMFGKRGVGKTSVANIITAIFTNVLVSKVTCNRDDTFYSIWEKAFEKIQFVDKQKNIGFTSEEIEYFTSLRLPENRKIDPTTIQSMLYNSDMLTLFIFDEFDNVTDDKTKEMMADTIKALSDNVPVTSILIIGISDSIDKLIGEHPSIERCIKQINVPEMSQQESHELINNYLNILKMSIDDRIRTKIIEYASGYPHYMHLLCKFAVKEAIYDQKDYISEKHFDEAVKLSIENSNYSLNQAFNVAISSASSTNQFRDVMAATSIVETDEDDSFTPEEVVKVFNKITNKGIKKESIHYNLGMLCKPERGDILEKTGSSRNKKYRFKNPLMKAFVKLKLHLNE